MTQKLEFVTRLLPFVEPRLNLIELAPKGTGKSYVFGNLSKFVWLVSGGKVSRAKLVYDKSTKAPGIMRFYDLVAFDEISSITFSDNSEIQSFLKNYLEYGRATVDNYEFMSECGLMLLGNILLSQDNQPLDYRYFDSLPEVFRESALLDRFHGMIEGWLLPRINVIWHYMIGLLMWSFFLKYSTTCVQNQSIHRLWMKWCLCQKVPI